jgi:hypothetical protein
MFIQRSDSVLTAVTNDNILAGNQFEFAPTRCIIDIALNASATGFEVDVLIGSRSIVTRMIPLIKTTAPIVPDDFVIRTGAQAGERIIIRLRNTSGGTLTMLTTVRFTPR